MERGGTVYRWQAAFCLIDFHIGNHHQLVGHARFQRLAEAVVSQYAPPGMFQGQHAASFGQVEPCLAYVVFALYYAQRGGEGEFGVAHHLDQGAGFAVQVAHRTDVGAYVCGSKFGKTPLAPVVSPKKTVEGAVGGSILALCTAMFIGWLIHIEWYQSLIAGFLITLFAQVGDLAESLIKRDAGVKDSGNSLPGHGGFLDRADSYLFSTPVAYFYFNYFVVSDQLTLDFISFARKALHAVGL